MLTRRYPYQGLDVQTVLQRVADGRLRPKLPHRLPEGVKQLLSDCCEERAGHTDGLDRPADLGRMVLGRKFILE